MNLPPISKSGTTITRKSFWDKARLSVLSSQKIAGRFVTVDEHIGQGTVINVNDTSARRSGGGTHHCTTGDTISVAFTGIVSCGCLTGSGLSFTGTDLGSLNSTYTLTRFSPTEFSFTDTLFNYKKWSNTDCTGDPEIDEDNPIIVYARCIEASGIWTVSIQDTVSFFFAFFASDSSTTLMNESSCSPFLFTDLFHNGTAIVSF